MSPVDPASMGRFLAACLLAGWLLFGCATSVHAQELSPRAYWPSPVGTRVLVTGYAYQSGDVLLDPTVPIYGVESRINSAILSYVQSLDLWGRNSNIILEVPYNWGSTQGILGEQLARADFSGFGDLAATLSVNLIGAPAMTQDDFQAFRAQPSPILGASLKLVLPTGYYKPDQFINVGGNRWATRLQLGAILPLRPRWLLELDAGAWLFGDDSDYIGGIREQEPIYSLEAHLVHRFRPGLWASLDANWFKGGEQTIDGEQQEDLQRNMRIGGTLVLPFLKRHAIKLGYSTSARTLIGSDSEQVFVTYQLLIP